MRISASGVTATPPQRAQPRRPEPAKPEQKAQATATGDRDHDGDRDVLGQNIDVRA
jgi:hypothetical protein